MTDRATAGDSRSALAEPLWSPSPERAGATRLASFLAEQARASGGRVCDAATLQRHAVADPARFWADVWRFTGIKGEMGPEPHIEAPGRVAEARLFPGGALNFAENLLLPALNGKLLENTLNEWQASRHAAEGRACQSCHMPERRHLWRGIHDAGMVREALTTDLTVAAAEGGRLQVRAEVRNTGAGHYFPTYLVPKVWLRLLVVDADGRERARLAEAVLAREVDVWLTEERSDTRLAPDAARVLEAQLAAPPEEGWQIELRVDVAPREHYERMFASVLRDSSVQLDTLTRGVLEAALAEARTARYTALTERRPLAAIAN